MFFQIEPITGGDPFTSSHRVLMADCVCLQSVIKRKTEWMRYSIFRSIFFFFFSTFLLFFSFFFSSSFIFIVRHFCLVFHLHLWPSRLVFDAQHVFINRSTIRCFIFHYFLLGVHSQHNSIICFSSLSFSSASASASSSSSSSSLMMFVYHLVVSLFAPFLPKKTFDLFPSQLSSSFFFLFFDFQIIFGHNRISMRHHLLFISTVVTFHCILIIIIIIIILFLFISRLIRLKTKCHSNSISIGLSSFHLNPSFSCFLVRFLSLAHKFGRLRWNSHLICSCASHDLFALWPNLFPPLLVRFLVIRFVVSN